MFRTWIPSFKYFPLFMNNAKPWHFLTVIVSSQQATTSQTWPNTKTMGKMQNLQRSVTRLWIGTFLSLLSVIYVLDRTGQRGWERGGVSSISMGRRYQDRRRLFIRNEAHTNTGLTNCIKTPNQLIVIVKSKIDHFKKRNSIRCSILSILLISF